MSNGSWVSGLSVFKEATEVPGAPGSRASGPVAPSVHHWGRQDSSFLLHEGKYQVSHQLLPWELGGASMGHGGKRRMDMRCLERFMNRVLGASILGSQFSTLGFSDSPLPASLTSHDAISPPCFLWSCCTAPPPATSPGASCSGSKRQRGDLSSLSLFFSVARWPQAF